MVAYNSHLSCCAMSHLVVQRPRCRSCISMRWVDWGKCHELRRAVNLFKHIICRITFGTL